MHYHGCANDRWARVPKPLRIAAYATFGTLFAVIFAAVFGYATMLLWNAVLPQISSLPALTFWQALGILVLARLLTGRFSHGSHRGRGFRRRFGQNADRYGEWWESEGKAAFDAYLQRQDSSSAGPHER